MDKKIVGILRDFLDEKQIESLSPSSKLSEFGISSLIMMEVISRIEDEFGITIPIERAMKFSTIGDFLDAINEKH